MGGRVVLHSDLNNCYASIECMLHPELRGKFIAVCGSTEDRHGIVLAKNQLAKQCGVKTGEVIWEARQKCPQLTIVPPHMDQYPNILFAIDGEVYDFNGNSCIVIGGAYSVDKYYRLARGWSWFPDEQPSEEIKAKVERVLAERNWKIDIVLSHTGPLKYEPTEVFLPMIDQSIVMLRKAAGLTVHDLQMAFGFNSPQAIYKWQNGTALPTVDNLIALAALLHVRIDDILITDHSVA